MCAQADWFALISQGNQTDNAHRPDDIENIVKTLNLFYKLNTYTPAVVHTELIDDGFIQRDILIVYKSGMLGWCVFFLDPVCSSI